MASPKSPGKRRPIFAFNSDLSLLATCSSDSRVKVWEAKTSTLVLDCSALASKNGAPDSSLLGPFTSLSWACAAPQLPGQTPGSRKKKNPSRLPPRHLLLAGTLSGDVIAWDPVAGSVAWTCERGVPEDSVTAITAANSTADASSAASIWVGTKTGLVCEVSVDSGDVITSFSAGKAAVASLAVSVDRSLLLVGGPSLRLFELPSRMRLWKVVGHTSPAACCAFSPDGRYALSAAQDERHVAIWDCSGASAQTAVGTLSTVDTVVSFCCGPWASSSEQKQATPAKASKTPAKGLRVLVVTAPGEAHLWCARRVPDLQSCKPVVIQQNPTQKATPSKGHSKGAIQAAALLQPKTGSPDGIAVVRGSIARPRVETVEVGREGEVKGGKVLLSTLEHGDLLPAASPLGKGSDETSGKGPSSKGRDKDIPEQLPVVAAAFPSSANGDLSVEEILGGVAGNGEGQKLGADKKKKKNKRKAAEEEASQEAATGEHDGAEVGETLEEKLQSLGIVSDGGELSGKLLPPQAQDGDGSPAGVPRGDSLFVLLEQAVTAEDDSLLESCLRVEDESIIANTVRRLQPRTAVKFLQLAVDRLASRPHRARVLAPWLRALCISHAALLMSSPGVQPLLMSLYQEVDARLALFQPMLSLAGRLDLVVSCIRQVEKGRKGGGEGTQGEELVGVAVYNEADDESDLEVEDATKELGEGEEEEEGEEEGSEDEEEEELEGDESDVDEGEDGEDEQMGEKDEESDQAGAGGEGSSEGSEDDEDDDDEEEE